MKMIKAENENWGNKKFYLSDKVNKVILGRENKIKDDYFFLEDKENISKEHAVIFYDY